MKFAISAAGAVLGCAAGLASSPPANAANLIGSTATVTECYSPTVSICYPALTEVFAGPFTKTVDGTVEFPFLTGSTVFSIQITGNQIIYTPYSTGAYADIGVYGFNGFVFAFSGAPAITGVSLDSSTDGNFTPAPDPQLYPPLSFTSDSITYNLSNVTTTYGKPIILDVALPATSAPEPATWAMMLLGLGGLGGAMRSRRAAEVATT
jgi:hypothetical protein